MKKFAIAAAALLMALTCVFAACGEKGEEMQERKLRDLPADVTYEYTKEEHSFSYSDEEFGTIEIGGEIYEPVGLSGKMPAVILCHGFGGHYNDFPAECDRLAKRGYVAYAFDFCGAQKNGRSTGRTAEEYTPFTMKKDLVETFKHIAGLPYVDETQVFLWGGSQGGFVAGLAAADGEIKDDVAGLALYFPAFNIPDDWRGKPEQTSYPFGTGEQSIGAEFIRSVQDLNVYSVIPAYKKGVCIVWGEADGIVKREYIDRAVTAYGADRTELTTIPGAGHGFVGEALTTAIDTVMAFLEAHTYQPL